MVQPLHIKNAHIWDSNATTRRDLYTTDVVTAQPANGAEVVDLDGYTIFPGLINAHDHLELNHYPRSKFREKYDNAHQWGEDMNVRLDSEPYKSLRAYPLWDKLFIGGLKNLLCGATTVVHHNPPHKDLWHKDFPVRVLRKYGWTHSLHFSTDDEIIRSYRSTPSDAPWFIHLAEGTDEVAAGEYKRLKALGCIASNTIIIHAVGITDEDLEDAFTNCRAIVWCPTTNEYLLGVLPDDGQRITNIATLLGSDSRLTSDNDLLGEMRAAGVTSIGSRHHKQIIDWTTYEAAQLLGLNNIGKLDESYLADWIAIAKPTSNLKTEEEIEQVRPNLTENEQLDLTSSEHFYAAWLAYARRVDLALVVKGGVPQIGDPDMMAKFPHVQTVGAILDGKPKRIHIDLARRIHACKLKEPGLEVDSLPKQGFKLWGLL